MRPAIPPPLAIASLGGSQKSRSVWNEVLSSVSTKKETKRTLLVFGDQGSGKTRLRERLQGLTNDESLPSGVHVEYDFLDIRSPEDPNGDVIARLDVRTVNGRYDEGQSCSPLLESSVNQETFVGPDPPDSGPIKSHCMALLVVDLSKPHSIPASVHGWFEHLEYLVTHTVNPVMLGQLKEGELEEMRKMRVGEAVEQPSKFLGIPIMIVGTKSDLVKPANDDLLHQRIRALAVEHGASLGLTTEWREETIMNVIGLIGHRLYGFDCPPQRPVDFPRNVFVMSGSDTMATVRALYKGRTIFEQAFPIPAARPVSGALANSDVQDHETFVLDLSKHLGISQPFVVPQGTTSPASGASSTAAPTLNVSQHHGAALPTTPKGITATAQPASAALHMPHSAHAATQPHRPTAAHPHPQPHAPAPVQHRLPAHPAPHVSAVGTGGVAHASATSPHKSSSFSNKPLGVAHQFPSAINRPRAATTSATSPAQAALTSGGGGASALAPAPAAAAGRGHTPSNSATQYAEFFSKLGKDKVASDGIRQQMQNWARQKAAKE